MTRIEAFLDDLDGRWTDDLPSRMRFRVLGSAALFLQTTYKRGTKDADVLRLAGDGFEPPTIALLEELAGARSVLFDRHRL